MLIFHRRRRAAGDTGAAAALSRDVIGYPVVTAGLVLAPRGVGTMMAMVMVGRLLRNVDPRLLIAVGLGITGARALSDDGLHARWMQATSIRTGVIQGSASASCSCR